VSADAAPTESMVTAARKTLVNEAVAAIATIPKLRERLVDVRKALDQTIDTTSKDEVLEAGYSQAATDKAKSIVQSWEQFIRDNKDEITALQILYNQPHGRVSFKDIKALADAIHLPPRSWTPESLWSAYEKLERDKVKGASGPRLLTDMVSLVRFALQQRDALVPYRDQVEERFVRWVAQQVSAGVQFTPAQREWLELIRDHVAASMGIDMDDFEFAPFAQRGGAGKAYQVFGERLEPLLSELNEVLAA
jgi:type I restriction enzyme, R subunit